MKEAKASWANLRVYLLAILVLASFSSCSGGRASPFLSGKDLGRVSSGTPGQEVPVGNPGLPHHPSQGPDAATQQKLQAAFPRLPLGFIPNRGQVVRLQFMGANPNPMIEGGEELPGKVNYFIGNDPARWERGLPTYGRVRYRELWPGIDLVYRGQEGRLKYEFVVKPGADPSRILLAYRGIEGLALSDAGDLILKTASGELRDSHPVAYQEIGGRRVAVEAGFRVGGRKNTGPEPPLDGRAAPPTSISRFPEGSGHGMELPPGEASPGGPVSLPGADEGIGREGDAGGGAAFVHGFEVKGYDPAYPLILDPDLDYSTFLGGSSGTDEGHGIALDANGNIYVTGFTYSSDFPTTAGAFDTSSNGNGDVFVAKLSANGSALLYSTFLGGNGDDWGLEIALDANGNAYVTGQTTSSNFPTVGAYDSTYNGQMDVFVARLSANGSALLYSTFLGGSSQDRGVGIALDANGNAYVTGYAWSSNFPTTAGAYDTSFNGLRDVFVAKLSANGSALLYSTFLGGSGHDNGEGIALDASGNAYVTGSTNSSDFPTLGAYDTTHNGGNDVFVAKLSANGSALLYATFLGGSGDDQGSGIALDASGNIYVTGYTASFNFPATSGAYDTTYNGGRSDVFVAKLSANGSELIYATFLGGESADNDFSEGWWSEEGTEIALDANGNAYVTGYTRSSNFPTTAGAFDTSYGGGCKDFPDPFPDVCGGFDAFVAKLSANGSTLVYATFLGGSGDDNGNGIALDAAGNIYVAGWTWSADFPTVGAYDPTYNNYGDVFVARLRLPTAGPGLALGLNQTAFRQGETLILTATVTPGLAPVTVDAYVAVRLPDGTLLFLQGDGSFTPEIRPIVAGWTVAPFEGEVFQYPFGGGEPPGNYAWLAAFTEPGTLNLIGAIVEAPFSFSP